MEEKIFIPQNNLSFDIQRFADLELDAGTYTLENVNGHKVICYFTNITGIGAAATSTSLVTINSSTKIVTIGGKTFKLANATADGAIDFYGTSSAVTKIEIENVAVTTDEVTYTPTDSAEIAFNAGTIQISGTVATAKSLNDKTYTTQGDDRDVTFNFSRSDTTKIDGITYYATNSSNSIKVTSDTVTLVSGIIEVGTDKESLNGNKFVVNSKVTATFNLANTDSVTISLADEAALNDIVYKAQGNNCVVEINYEEITLDGKFEITLSKDKSIELGGITFKANDKSAVTFTYNDGEISGVEGELGVNSKSPKNTVTVDGVTYNGLGDLSFTDSLITVDGAFSVGDGAESLSGKKFSFTEGNEVKVKLATGDSNVTLNDTTYTAGTDSLELTASSDKVNIFGTGATVKGTGNFVIETKENTVNINGIDFKNTDADAKLQFTATDIVKISSAFTVGDGSQNINLKIAADSEIAGSTFNLGSNGTVNVEGVTYKGNGTVEIGETAADINLSGSSISVGSADEDLSGKNFKFDSTCAATFEFNDSGSVKINGDTYSAADSTGGSVEVKAGGAVTVANSSVSFDTTSSATPKTLTISSGKDLTLNNIKYTAKDSDAKVTVDGTSIKIDSGTVAVDATSDFSVKLAENATAQINDVNFKKTASTSNSTDDIAVQDGAITLNSKFTVGNGTQKLNNLVVTLTTSDESIFKLGTADSKVTIIQDNGASYDDVTETGERLNGVTYTGSGNVTNTGTTSATLDGDITVTGAPENFTLNLTSGKVTVNGSSVSGSGTVTVGTTDSISVSGNGVTEISTSGTVTVGEQTFNVTGGAVTLSVENGSVNSVSNNGANNVSVQIDSGEPYTIQSNGTLTSNGTGWSGGVTYTSYLYDNGTMWGIYDGGSETLVAGAYTDILNNGVLQSGKSLTAKNATISYGNYTYSVSGTAQFTGSDDGIDSIADSGSVTATATGAIGVQLGNGASLSKGVFTYTESGSGSSANIDVAANGGVTATSGEIEKQISSGDFTYKSATYTVDSAVTFKVGGSNTDGTYLQSGSGYRTASGNISVGGKSYSMDSGKYVAKGNESGGYTAFSGTALYTASSGDTFTISNKNYTSTGNAVYKYESQGLQSGGTSTTLQSATGTRAFNATKDTETKTHGEYTYNVTAGTYTIGVTEGGGTETLTSGSATKTFTAGEALSYKIDGSTRNYSAEAGATFNISFNDSTITNGTPSGFAKRTAPGETYSLTGTNAGDYILSSGAIMRLTLGETSSETFYSGSATRQTTTYTNGTNTYTGLNGSNLTLTLTKNNGNDGGVAFTSGSGTRTAAAGDTSFTNGDKTYTSNDKVYISENGGEEDLYSATGTRTDVTNEKYTVGTRTYTLTSGTYDIAVANKNYGTETLKSASGTAQVSDAFTEGGKNYTPIGNVTFTLTVDSNGTESEAFIAGNVTYNATGNEFTYNTKTYTTNGDIINKLVRVSGSADTTSTYKASGTRDFDATKDTADKTFAYTDGNTYTVKTGTYSINVDSGTGTESALTKKTAEFTTTNGAFKFNDKDYTAVGAVTLGLTYTGNTPAYSTKSGKGTRPNGAGDNLAYTSEKGNAYTLTAATYQIDLPSGAETQISGEATKSLSSGNFYFNNQTYTVKDTVGLGLNFTTNNAGTKTETETFNSGSGTRSATDETASYTDSTGKNKSYDFTNVVKILHAGETEKLYSANGTSTDVAGDNKIVGSNTYNLTSGTYSINVVNDTTTATAVLDSAEGSTTVASNATFQITGDTNTYTAFNNAVNLNFSYSNNTDAETFTGNVTYDPAESSFTYSGETYNKTSTNVTYKKDGSSGTRELYAATGTRSANGGSYTTTSVNTAYTLTNGTYETKVVNGAVTGTGYKDKVISGNGTQSIAQNATFTLNNVEYTALNGSVTLNLSINGSTPLESFTGDATYNDATETSFSKNGHNYTKTSTNITYKKTNSDGTPSVYAAEGTRPYVTADDDTTTYKNDTYSVTAGTYKATVTAGTLTEALDTSTNRTAVFSTTNGTFHFNEKEYGATGYTTFKLTYNNEGTPSMSEASGKGTRTASGDSAIKVIYENDTYTTNDDSTIQIDITGPSDSTESFLFGTATHTGSTFHYGGKEYSNATGTITYTKASASATPTKTFSADSAGTRTESKTAAATFTFSDKIYSTTSTNVTYRASTQSAGTSLTEVVYAADGTRKADGTDKVTGAWDNEYTMPAGTGTVSITVATGSGTPAVTAGTATKTIAATTGTFTYSDRNTYTANKEVTLSLNVSDNGSTKTETFTSGSASNGTSHIVKEGSQITIGDVTYTATDATQADKIVNITGSASGITALSNGKLTGDFTDGKSATIGGIAYTATGASKLAINNTAMNDVTAEGGTFTAEGNFTADGWQINSSAFQVTGDTNIKATFDSTGVTKIENVSGTATVTTATTLTSIVTDGDGSFTIGNKTYTIATEDNNGVTFTLNNGNVTKIQKTAGKGDGTYTVNGTKFVIDNDNVDGITFNLDDSYNVSKIEGLDRNTDSAYVKVTVADSATPIYLRRTSNTLEKTNGNWTEPEIVNFYVVTYEDGTGFKVQAADNNGEKTLVNIKNTDDVDYELSDSDKTLTFKADKKDKEVVVINETTTNIKVNDVDGINQTENSAIKIGTDGKFNLGTFDTDTLEFSSSITTADGKTINTEDFKVNDNGTFSIDNTGKITVKPVDATKIVNISVPTDTSLVLSGNGKYTVNDPTSLIKVTSSNANIQVTVTYRNGTIRFKANGKCTIDNLPLTASSADLAESADSSPTYYSKYYGDILVTVVGDDDGLIGIATDDNGSFEGLKGISENAIITLRPDEGFTLPDTIKINDSDVTAGTPLTTVSGTRITYNSTLGGWVSGEATADSGNTYTVIIGADNKVYLYTSAGKQTTNVADYKKVFGNTTTIKPDKDGGDVPIYPANGISFVNGTISELKITPATTASSYKIGSYDVTVSAETTFKPTANNLEVTLKAGGNVTYGGLTYTSTEGTSTAVFASSGITLDANAKVTNTKSGVTFTAKTANSTLTFDNITVKDLAANTEISGVNPATSTLSIKKSGEENTQALTVKGDAQYTVDAGDKKIITGIGTGAVITANGYTIETNEVGNFTIGGAEFKTAGGDKKVTFKIDGTSGKVTEIADLDANESVSGNFSGGIKVNKKDVQVTEVTGDTEIGVVGGSSTVSKIYGLNNNGVVTKDGGAATVSTAEAGTFKFGDQSATTYAISAGTADFVLSSSAVTGIKNIDGTATVSVYQDESALAVESDNIKITNNTAGNEVKLVMGGDNIATVSGLAENGKIEGLSNGALVDVSVISGNAVKINTADFLADKAATVYAAAGGYDSVKVTDTNTTFETIKDGAIVIPDAAGTYTFNRKAYEFSATPILKAGASNGLDSIGGLASGQHVIISASESGLKVGKDTIKFTKGSHSGGVKLVMGNDTVGIVEDLYDGDKIESLTAGALVIPQDKNVSINVNGKDFTITNSSAKVTVQAKTGGYDVVTGLKSGSVITKVDTGTIIIPDDASGNYTFGSSKYEFSAKPSLVSGTDKLASIGGLANGQTVVLDHVESVSGFYIGANEIKLDKVSDSNANVGAGKKVTFTMGDNNTVKSVTNLQDAVDGLSAGATVKVTSGGAVKINNKALQISDTDYSVIAASGGYSTIKGVAKDSTFTTVGDTSAIIIPDESGTFTFGSTTYTFDAIPTLKADGGALKEISLTGGQSVTLNTVETALKVGNNANLAVSGIVSNLKLTMDATGQNIATVENLKGGINNLNADAMIHMTESSGTVTINSTAANLEFSGNTETITAHVTSGGYDYVKGLVGGTSAALAVTNAKNVSLVTAKQGKFNFGGKTYDISGDDEVTVKTDDSSQITEMDGITDALVTFSQAETALKINGKDVKVASGDVLKIDGNGVVSGITGTTAGGTYNLPGNVTIAVNASGDDGVTVNGKNLKVGDQTAVTVHTAADTLKGYDWVAGLKTDATVSAVGSNAVEFVTAEDGTFTFGNQTVKTDDAQITLKTSTSNSISEIYGIDASKYVYLYNNAQTGLKVNGKEITVTGSYSASNKLKLTVGNNGTIESVENLQGNINGLNAGALVQVKNSTSAVQFNSSTDNLKTNDDEITVHATADGFDYITGLNKDKTVTTAATVSIVTAEEGTFNFPNQTLKTDDAQVTLKTGANSTVTAVGGLDAGKNLMLYQTESGLSVNGHLITVAGAGANANEQVTLTMGANDTISKVENLRGNINGLTAGAMVEVKKGSAIKFNSATDNLSIKEPDGTDDKTQITVRASNGGFDYIEGLTGNNTAANAPVVTTAKNVSIVTDGAGIFKFTGQTLETDDAQITLKTGADSTVTAVGGLDAGKKLALYQAEDGLSVNGHLITVTGADGTQQVTLTMGNSDTIETVKNLRGDINGLNEGALIKVTDAATARKINSGTANLQITGDNNITVHATSDGYDTITGLTGSANTSNAPIVTTAKDNATLITDATGAFKFQVGATPTEKTFTTNGDTNVAFVMGTGSKLDGIYNLDGTVKGDFSDVLKIEGKNILITNDQDDEISVVAAEGKVTKLAGITYDSSGANAVVVKNSGGAATISSGAGLFQFADTNPHSFSISAGTADFLSVGDVPTITGIKSLSDNAQVVIYQNETDFAVENNTLKLISVDGTNGLTLKMDGDTIKTVENLKGEVSGLSAGATVNVATASKVTVNGVALKIDDNDDAYVVKAAVNGYNLITGVSGDGGSNAVTIEEAVNASIEIETDNDESTAEEFIFGPSTNQKTYTINEASTADQKVTFTTDANTNVIAINGLNGTLKSNENNSTIRVNNVDVYSSSANVSIVANNTADQGISSVVGLTDNNMVNVPAGVAVQVNLNTPTEGVNDLIQFTINGTAYDLIGESDSISVKDKTIKGLDANARLTISSAEGNYKVNGTELTLSEGHNVVVGEATGAHLYEPGAIDFASFTPTDEIIERVFGEQVAATITPATINADNKDETYSASPGAVIISGGTGSKAKLNADKQLAVVKAADNTVEVAGTDDSVIASANVTVALAGSTNARLMQTAGTMIVTGYDYYSTGAGIQLTNSDVVAAVRDSLTFDGLNITNLGNGAAMNITYGANSNVVNLYDINGKKTILNYASAASQTLNALQSSNASAILRGNWGTTSYSGLKLYGGNGNDTAFGGDGDYFNLGNGNNYLELKSGHSSAATIELTASSGNTTVEGFNTGSDIIKLDAGNADVEYTTEGLVFTKGNASLTMQNIEPASGSNGSYVNVKIQDSNANAATLTAVAMKDAAIKVINENTTAFVGSNSALDFSEYTDKDVAITLGTGAGTLNSSTRITLRGITSLKGGSGSHTLIGAGDQSNTLSAGNGGGTIWGQGASGDLLIAADYSTGKSGSTFMFASGDGSDTVSNIQFYDTAPTPTKDNAKMDTVSIEGGSVIDVKTANNNVVIGINGSDSLTVKDAVGERFKANVDGAEYLVQVGKNEVTFDKNLVDNLTGVGAECYITSSTNGTLKISDSSGVHTGDVINLNGTSTYTISDNIKSIDASGSSVALKLNGSSTSDNIIKASSHGDTLFGGDLITNDTLYSGSDSDTFVYSIQSNFGNDVIENAGCGKDIVYFGNNSYSGAVKRIVSISATDDVAVLKFTTGGSLTLKKGGTNSDLSNVKFKFSNAEKDLEALQAKVNGSADLAENYWENGIYANELLDGDSSLVQSDSAALTFGNDVKNIAHSNGELLTGNVQYSLAGGEQVYNFSELVKKNNG